MGDALTTLRQRQATTGPRRVQEPPPFAAADCWKWWRGGVSLDEVAAQLGAGVEGATP